MAACPVILIRPCLQAKLDLYEPLFLSGSVTGGKLKTLTHKVRTKTSTWAVLPQHPPSHIVTSFPYWGCATIAPSLAPTSPHFTLFPLQALQKLGVEDTAHRTMIMACVEELRTGKTKTTENSFSQRCGLALTEPLDPVERLDATPVGLHWDDLRNGMACAMGWLVMAHFTQRMRVACQSPVPC